MKIWDVQRQQQWSDVHVSMWFLVLLLAARLITVHVYICWIEHFEATVESRMRREYEENFQ